ncbi:uncharacterized protein LOC135372269 [Ornithodoros turicata]|uniref:uncharacterized protein LOC135372269 n=1 Tax=Ornithodoros turicata TaxID=34597 RepID=UPI0031394F83
MSAGRILCFATQGGLTVFCEADEVFVDGTFFSCPSIFFQVLTVSSVKNGCSVNTAYFLLPGKSREVYVAAFMRFLECLSDHELRHRVTVVRTDFEVALIQALLYTFPRATHRGCHFRFGQAIWRKVQVLGLSTAYSDDPSVKAFVRKSVSLAFVPVSFVRVAWNELKATAPLVPGIPAFILYFEDVWMMGSFDIKQWNHYNNRSARTNNLKEAWHRKINHMLGKAHPNIYAFIDMIKKDEAPGRVTLLQLSSGGRTRKRMKKWDLKDEEIR